MFFEIISHLLHCDIIGMILPKHYDTICTKIFCKIPSDQYYEFIKT